MQSRKLSFNCFKRALCGLGVSSPGSIVISSRELMITWREPDQPNGVVREYRLYRSDSASVQWAVIYAGQALTYTDTSLVPGNVYHYMLEVSCAYPYIHIACIHVLAFCQRAATCWAFIKSRHIHVMAG